MLRSEVIELYTDTSATTSSKDWCVTIKQSFEASSRLPSYT